MQEYPLLDRERILTILKDRFRDGFLNLKDLPDPSRFKDMDRAVERIVRAIRKGERIVLIGDYDVDGVVATSVMRLFFERIGYPLQWIIPNRFRDGYGLSPGILDRIGSAEVILTVDNGISAVEAARICRDRGIDLIITDHHIVPDTPPEAYAIVDQKQPDCPFPYNEVCGAQIAWYLCAALRRRLDLEIDMREYLEYVALAIIADVMPLQHINRAMVQQGLRYLTRSEQPYAQAYRELNSKKQFTAEDLAFGLTPMLNSAGRMEDASVACDYLCASDILEARTLLTRLQGYNERRKGLEREITRKAIQSVNPESPVLLAVGEGWHEGVLGIVASRLAERFRRPALVLTATEDGYKGSGRSYGDCDLFSIINEGRSHLEKFGGHRAAIGLSLRRENLEAFRQKLMEAGSECRDRIHRDPEILGELPLDRIDGELYQAIQRFEPFGEGNPRPKFVLRNTRIEEMRRLGTEKEHLKIWLGEGEERIEGIHFRCDECVESGDRVDLQFTLNENHFNGRNTLQLMIRKIRLSDEV